MFHPPCYLFARRRSFFCSLAFLFLFSSLFVFSTSQSAQAGQATLAWDPETDPNVAGYKVYLGNGSQSYQSSLDVGNKTTATVTNLQDGATYYFAVTAYDSSKNESGYSNEVSYRIPASCTYSVSPLSQPFDSAGATGSVGVTTPAGCPWTAVSNASWVMITSNVSASGNGTTYYSVSPNTGLSSRSGTLTIAGKTVTLNQSGAAQYSLSISKAGTGSGTVTNNPAGSTFNDGTTVILTAAAGSNSTFAGWSGACTGTSPTCTLTMNANASVTAAFNLKTYTVTATAGANGTITPQGTVSVNSGANQSFTITPNSGYKISDVKVDGTSVGAVASFLFGAVMSNHTIDATFASLPPQTGSPVYALNSGGSAYTDKSGIIYTADKYYQGGRTGKTYSSIAGTEDDPLYKTERYGSFSYSLPVTNGNYLVTLKFAEDHWSSANRRKFNVKIEGQQVITSLDIFAKVGKNRAYDVTFPVTVSDGAIRIEFIPVRDSAKVNAILIQKAP